MLSLKYLHMLFFFFFSSRRRHTRFDCDWSSDVCSSDLGAFNANLIREARHRIDALEGAGATVALHIVGKKGITFFKFAKRPIASQRTDIGDKPTAAHAAELVEPLMAQFSAGAPSTVWVLFAPYPC